MSLSSTAGNFIIVDAHTSSPKFFWKGVQLTDVTGINLHHSGINDSHVRLRVLNTTSFDTIYVEMASVGIIVKKVNT